MRAKEALKSTESMMIRGLREQTASTGSWVGGHGRKSWVRTGHDAATCPNLLLFHPLPTIFSMLGLPCYSSSVHPTAAFHSIGFTARNIVETGRASLPATTPIGKSQPRIDNCKHADA